MREVLQIVFDALSLGSLYALGALGIALIFGVMRLVNFAHGDFIAFCVFAMLWPSINAAAIVFAGNLPFYLLVPLLLVVGATLSVLSEVIVFRRFRNTNPATMMIASFALGFVIRHLLLMLFSSRPKSITLWPNLSLPIELAGARSSRSSSRWSCWLLLRYSSSARATVWKCAPLPTTSPWPACSGCAPMGSFCWPLPSVACWQRRSG
jgi:branched-subunit amino acid ABC-type transport system permease component